jgi:hypothetical protein
VCQAFVLETLPPDGFLYPEDLTVGRMGRMIARAFLVLYILLSLLFVRLHSAIFFEDIRSKRRLLWRSAPATAGTPDHLSRRG